MRDDNQVGLWMWVGVGAGGGGGQDRTVLSMLTKIGRAPIMGGTIPLSGDPGSIKTGESTSLSSFQ